MSHFIPGHFSEYPPPVGEEPSHLEHPQDLGQTNLVISEMPRVVVKNPLDDTLQALSEELSHPEQLQSPGETCITGVKQLVITAIRATDLTFGLRRIPAGFHVVVKTGSAEFETSNKHVHVDQTVVEWNELILLPCEPSSKVRVRVYASFESGPMLYHGEILRTFEITVQELLDRSESSHPIIFQQKEGEVVSPCTSLFLILGQRLSDENDPAVLCPLTTLASRDMDALVLKTDAGHRLLARYRRTQNSSDLYQSIKHFEHASDLCPMDHPHRSAALFNLATAKLVSCQADGRYLDLDIPISVLQGVLDLRPTDHPDRSVTQLYLAIALLFRFAERGFQTDADASEELLSEVVDVCHADSHIYRAALIVIETSALHSARSIVANDLGQEWSAPSMHPLSPNQLIDQVQWCMQRDDPHALDEVISLHYDALRYYNTGHACRGQLLGNLSTMLSIRFERRGNDEDLDQAIAFHREALPLFPIGHTDRSSDALALRPVGRIDRSLSLNNLASLLSSRFRHRGKDEDLDQAIALNREALACVPVGHTDRSGSLNNLANRLSSRFEHRGNAEDLNHAIALEMEALDLRPVGHIDRFLSLNNLASLLSSRFRHRGKDEDLDQAIALSREALVLVPVGHASRSMSLNNLANQLFSRFEHRGNDEDLDHAIALLMDALAMCPVAHTDRCSSSNNLAILLFSRFNHRSNVEDLDQAIALNREVLALVPVGHTNRSKSLNNLANLLSSHFEHRGNDEDLDQAIALHREALVLRPVGHPGRPKSLYNLANRLSSRFDHRGNREDLNESQDNLRCASTLLTQHDPFQFKVRVSLATVYLSFHHSGLGGAREGEVTDSLNTAMHYFKKAANVVSAGLQPRLQASLHWVRHTRQHSHGTELEAHATSMQLLDAYMSTTASVSSRHNIMKHFSSTLAVDAASCALRSGDVCRAVELLEQGRTTSGKPSYAKFMFLELMLHYYV
ncbi:hypothetical protein BD769DRAFT_1774633 [Suillus cothurnatus]|nr:hypothetical protein BD769DRAFT_1774633 [Suillus cothurnatus]